MKFQVVEMKNFNLSFLSPLFYFSLGIVIALYVLMILRKDQKKKISEFENNSIVKFYLNIFVQNKEEALNNVMKAKMANKFIAGLAGAIANNVVDDEKFSTLMGTKVSPIITQRLHEMGIKSDVFLAYAYANFLCIEVNLICADAKKVIEKKAGKEKVQEFENFLGIFGMPQLNNSIDDTLAGIIGNKMQAALPNVLREKMADKIGLDVKVICCSEGEQATFLLGTLKQLKQAKEE